MAARVRVARWGSILIAGLACAVVPSSALADSMPTLAASFGPTAVQPGGTSELLLTVTNPAGNESVVNGVGFYVTLPLGLDVASSTAGACGGSMSTQPRATSVLFPASISVSGVSVSVGSECQISVPVIGADAGSYTVTTSDTPGSYPMAPASANLSVPATALPPIVTAEFSPSTPLQSSSAAWTATITNPNPSTPLTDLSFGATTTTQTIPTAITANTCGGSATTSLGGLASPADPSAPVYVALGGGLVAPGGSCAVTAAMSPFNIGPETVTVTVDSAEGGPSATASSSVTVIQPAPSVTAATARRRILVGRTTRLTIALTAAYSQGIGFVVELPSGLSIARRPAATDTCGGTLTAKPGSRLVQLAGASAATTMCMVGVEVKGQRARSYRISTGQITSATAATAAAVTTQLTVVPQRRLRSR